MATGLPIITTTAAGEIGERVLDEINGLTVPPDDPDALFAAMKHLANDPDLRKRMGLESAKLIAPYTPASWGCGLRPGSDVDRRCGARRLNGRLWKYEDVTMSSGEPREQR